MINKKLDKTGAKDRAAGSENLSCQNDETKTLRLILRAREDDGSAFEMLAQDYRPMLSAAVSQYRGEVGEQDFEEIEQEALLAFHRAVMKYDVLRGGVKFGLYAKVCVNKAIISALRKISRRKKHLVLLPIDDSSLIGVSCPADSVIERENERELRRVIKENLSDFENSVWWLYYSGMSTDEIAKRVDRPKKSVENAITRVRRKLKAILTQSRHDRRSDGDDDTRQ